jgi:hypothetical protein
MTRPQSTAGLSTAPELGDESVRGDRLARAWSCPLSPLASSVLHTQAIAFLCLRTTHHEPCGSEPRGEAFIDATQQVFCDPNVSQLQSSYCDLLMHHPHCRGSSGSGDDGCKVLSGVGQTGSTLAQCVHASRSSCVSLRLCNCNSWLPQTKTSLGRLRRSSRTCSQTTARAKKRWGRVNQRKPARPRSSFPGL